MTPRQHRRWVKELHGLIQELRDMQPHLDDLQAQITALRARAGGLDFAKGKP